MIYSDLYIGPKTKIEILPSDNFDRKQDVLIPGDTLFTVFRTVGKTFVADIMKADFPSELKYQFESGSHSVRETLELTLNAFNFCFYARLPMTISGLRAERWP